MPSLPVTLAFLGTAVFVFAGPLAAGYWVYRDASSRGSERAWPYGVAATLFPIPVVPLYLLVRRRWPARQSWTRRDRAAGSAAVALLAAWIVATFVAPPDPFAQLARATVTAVAVAGVAHAVAVKRVRLRGPSQ